MFVNVNLNANLRNRGRMSYFGNSYFGAPYFPAAYFAKVTLVSTRAVRVILPARSSDPDNRPALRKNLRVVDDNERPEDRKGGRGNADSGGRLVVEAIKRAAVVKTWRQTFGGYLR
jgi:hypothetical protein